MYLIYYYEYLMSIIMCKWISYLGMIFCFFSSKHKTLECAPKLPQAPVKQRYEKHV